MKGKEMGKRMKAFSRLASHVSYLGALAVFVPSACFAAAQPAVSLPPFIITGRIIDYRGSGLSSAEVRVRKGSTLLARGNVGKFEADTSANYALSVPMSNVDIPTAASTGDALTLEIDAGTETYSDTNVIITAATPGRILKLNIRAASCTNPYGVSDAYLNDIRIYVDACGIDGFLDANGNYQPNADFDGDGVSNYAEYLAGTDPFDADDAGLRILSWKAVDGNPDLMEATFLPGPNRSYSAERADTSGNGISPTFELRPHQLTPEQNAVKKNYLNTGNEDPEVRAIYLYKEGASSLYRLRLE